MTDHPGRPDDQPDPSAPPPGSSDPDTPDTGAAPSRTPDDRPAPPSSSSFDAAFQGESWDSRRRRRSSSSSSSSAAAPPPSGPPTSSPEGAGSSRRRRSSRRSSSSGRANPPAAATVEPGTARSRRKQTRQRRRIGAVTVHVVLGLLGLGLAWVVVTGIIAALQLNDARSDLAQLRSQITAGGTGVNQAADQFATHAHHAAVMTRGPAWAVVAAIPYVGDPFESIRGITRQTSTLADAAVPGLVAAVADVNPRTVVQAGAVDLDALQRAAGPVHTAAAAVSDANTRVTKLPRSTWLPVVDHATSDLSGQLGSLTSTLRTTDQALQVLPTMLGARGQTKRYFVAFQNNAELRGTGGLPGAFAIVSAVNGKVSIDAIESDDLLGGSVPSGLDFGKAYDAHYANDSPYDEYVDSNVSPHFPYAAQIWCAMWLNIKGQRLDGALTIDPGALSYLLAATGSATAPDGQKVSSANVVSLLQKDVYARFPQPGDNPARKQYILDIASAAEKKVLTGGGNSRKLLNGLARAVSERRIVAWSSDTTIEKVLASATVGGTVAATTEPYSLLSLNNGAAGKLDYYLGRSVTWERTGCGDTRDVTVTIALTNHAPATGLPRYVTNRSGLPPPPGFVVGQNRTLVDYVATDGAQLVGATLDGKPSGVGVFDEEGHPTYRTITEIKPGQTVTIVLHLTEPAGTKALTVAKQPAVLPLAMKVDDRSCS